MSNTVTLYPALLTEQSPRSGQSRSEKKSRGSVASWLSPIPSSSVGMDQLLRPTRHLLRSTGACSPRAPALARSLPPSFFPPRSPHANSNAACPTLRRCWPAARRTSISAFALRTFVTQPPKPAPPARSNPSPATPADSAASSPPPAPPSLPPNGDKKEPRENIYTIPNALTAARIIACPAIGYYILKGDLATATGLLFVAGVSDLVRFPTPSGSNQ